MGSIVSNNKVKKLTYSELLKLINNKKLNSIPICNVFIDVENISKCKEKMDNIPNIKFYTIKCCYCDNEYTRDFDVTNRLLFHCYECRMKTFIEFSRNHKIQLIQRDMAQEAKNEKY